MKALVIGKGGREHGIVKALMFSTLVHEVHCLPGSDGMKSDCICHSVDSFSFDQVYEVVRKNDIGLVIIGPEAEIAAGLSDFLRSKNILVFAPSQSASQLEASKILSKEFMVRAGVPTAPFKVVRSVEDCQSAASEFTPPFVLKADGLAAGKGVFICKNLDELMNASRALFEDKLLGESGRQALLEQYQEGYEISYLIVTNGKEFLPLPLAQDHKRLKDRDEGPNTGGMGVVAPVNIKLEIEEKIHQQILEPTILQMQKENMLYRGVLFVGVMVTKDGPTVLEYNVRFGDPEAQVILPLLEGDWGEVFFNLAKGELVELNWKPLYTACVVLAAEGYPEGPKKGVLIEGNPNYQTPSSYFLHAGTQLTEDGDWLTNGGRVLNAIGVGSSVKESLQVAYSQVKQVHWQGYQYRTDIGAKVVQSKL